LPLERKYRSNAERQAVNRDRHPEQHFTASQFTTETKLASLALRLHVVFVEAVEADQSPRPHDLGGDPLDQTLRNFTRFLDPRLDRFFGGWVADAKTTRV